MQSIVSTHTSARFHIALKLPITTTPGPEGPKDPESFTQSVMEQFNVLARGVHGLKVAEMDRPQEFRVFLLQLTSDMPGGNRTMGMKGSNDPQPSRFQTFHGVWVARSNLCYFPAEEPSDKPASRANIFEIKNYHES